MEFRFWKVADFKFMFCHEIAMIEDILDNFDDDYIDP